VSNSGWRRAPVRRRTVLAGGVATGLAAGLGLTGCGQKPVTGPKPTVRSVTAAKPFFIASRVGARDWPEMTMHAFEQAATIPELQAVDLAVCRTKDGVLICSYDLDTLRLTGQSYTIADQPWSVLQHLKVSAAETSDTTQPAQPFARLDEVLERFIDRFVFFVEPRGQEQVVSALMARLTGANTPERIVWKEPVNSRRFAEARRHGFGTWGYILNEPAHTGENLTRLAASSDITMLGVSAVHTDKLIRSVADAASAYGKPAIAWNIVSREDIGRTQALGCTGMATTSIRRILRNPTPASPSPTPSARR
jgi:glycerophosphoryl diester phosphodiesterase